MDNGFGLLIGFGLLVAVIWMMGFGLATTVNRQHLYVAFTKRLIMGPAKRLWARHKIRITWFAIGLLLALFLMSLFSTRPSAG